MSAIRRSHDAARPIRVLILEDHPVAADGLRTYLETDESMDVVGIYWRGEDIAPAVNTFGPDIVIVDLVLSGSHVDGIEAGRRLRSAHPDLKLLALSAYQDQHLVLGAIKAGFNGFILKTSSQHDIIEAVHMVMANRPVFDQAVLGIIQLYLGHNALPDETPPFEALTPREWKVLDLIADDRSNAEIAEELSIEVSTVKTHVSKILKKLNVPSRKEAAMWRRLNRSSGAKS